MKLQATASLAMNSHRDEILNKLVSFDTISRRSNMALIDYIKGYLAEYNIESKLIKNTDNKKANLIARLGPDKNGGIMLSGHTDVVPVEGQNWSYPPFELTRCHDRFYGRGTTDMKGFLACVLSAIPDFLNRPLSIPVYLAFSYDEEVGCLGVRSLLDFLDTLSQKPDMCIVGEPTEMHPVYGHKGKVALRCNVRGHACHSAYTPMGVNAIEYASKVIQKLSTLGLELSTIEDQRFDPPFSTLQVGTIIGGSALNIVPQDCSFDFEIRHLPTLSVERLLENVKAYVLEELVSEMRQVSEDSSITFEPLTQYPGLLTDTKTSFSSSLSHWCASAAFSTVSFGTEGGLFDQAGIATLVCGPGCMDQGHKADEFITIEQLDKCTSMLRRLSQSIHTK